MLMRMLACAAQMMRCEEYPGRPGSGGLSAQPFRVGVAPAAAVAMDFHAHLNMNEVVGLLAGTYDAEAGLITCASLTPWADALLTPLAEAIPAA